MEKNELAPIKSILKGGNVGATYLRIPPGTTEEEWARLATKVTTIGHGYWWWVGDLAAFALHGPHAARLHADMRSALRTTSAMSKLALLLMLLVGCERGLESCISGCSAHFRERPRSEHACLQMCQQRERLTERRRRLRLIHPPSCAVEHKH